MFFITFNCDSDLPFKHLFKVLKTSCKTTSNIYMYIYFFKLRIILKTKLAMARRVQPRNNQKEYKLHNIKRSPVVPIDLMHSYVLRPNYWVFQWGHFLSSKWSKGQTLEFLRLRFSLKDPFWSHYIARYQAPSHQWRTEWLARKGTYDFKYISFTDCVFVLRSLPTIIPQAKMLHTISDFKRLQILKFGLV